MNREDYLTHLHDARWQIIRVTTGKGVEISNNPFVVLPKAIKLLTEDDPVRYKDYVRFIVKDFRICKEIAPTSLDYIFVTEQESTLIDDFSIDQWQSKLKVGGFLITHTITTNLKYIFTILKKGEDGLSAWYPPTLPKKNVGVIRYGAFGDMLQASSVFAGLKKQGYHVTVYCSPPGNQVILHDPNIDEIVTQDKDQVRNIELTHYFKWLETKHTKLVNLCESVEKNWLVMKEDSRFNWSFPVRDKYLNTNYVQFQHELAGVPHSPKVKFYATPEEIQWAKTERSYMSDKKLIMWCLTGSSVHKIMPWMDEYVARFMVVTPDVDVVLVGGDDAVMLEGGWQNEPRVHRRTGLWTIRQTLVFAQTQIDLLIGPETGVMNAMCNEDIEKIIFLSHSTVQNLTRDWNRTHSMVAPEYELKKCGHCCLHRLHYGWDDVMKDEETGVAHCQAKINREELFTVSLEKLGLLKKLKAYG